MEKKDFLREKGKRGESILVIGVRKVIQGSGE